ncbi:MAG: amylo-alpha-1,6-glucosidase [bacterium]|nr:amylo-alpha-1,6-glucosidase [bacterium]
MNKKEFGKSYYNTFSSGIRREWAITNGIGGYAGSSIIGANTRKHHGLLIASLHAPVKRYLLLSKLNESLCIGGRTYDLATNQRPGNINEEGQRYLQRFLYDGLPRFVYSVSGVFLTKTISFEYGKNTVAIQYEIEAQKEETSFTFVPFFNYRDHGERSERADLQFVHSHSDHMITLTPERNKAISIQLYTSEGTITPRKEIYDSDLVLQTEIDTGMTSIDNNFTPYEVTISLQPFEKKRISVICSIEQEFEKDAAVTISTERARKQELTDFAGLNDSFANDLVLAADQFIVTRASTNGKTILAGLPWFTDWGRDTMIALQGLTLVTKRFDDAKSILRTFAAYVSHGLVPNMFPDEGLQPLYNTADASLWYFHSVSQYLSYANSSEAYKFVEKELYPKLEEIVLAYRQGTDFSIYMEEDGLIHAGSGLDQVTWMDVRVGDWVVTPRHGKPVEINALWYNALRVMEHLSKRFGKLYKEYEELANKVKDSFNQQFWNKEKNCLYDVVSSDYKDDKIRPNQIYAVSLPYTMLSDERATSIVNTVLSELYVSYGLRSLSPFDKDYKGTYFGKLHDRDAAYHQGTAWAYPLGALVTAYVKVHHRSPESIAFARKLLAPIKDHLMDGCIGSIAEIFDGDEPNQSRGCYAQAWSVGEILRSYVEDILNNEPKSL